MLVGRSQTQQRISGSAHSGNELTIVVENARYTATDAIVERVWLSGSG